MLAHEASRAVVSFGMGPGRVLPASLGERALLGAPAAANQAGRQPLMSHVYSPGLATIPKEPASTWPG